ncbi:hypothetical protein RYX36_015993 [Vicia faba]
MAYRRKQYGTSKSSPSIFENEPIRNPNPITPSSSNSNSSSNYEGVDTSSSSLAAKAIRASSARRDSSLSSLYGHSNLSSPRSHPTPTVPPSVKDSRAYEYTSMKRLDESKNGFWGVLARKAKSIIEDDGLTRESETPGTPRSQFSGVTSRGKGQNLNHLEEGNLKRDSPTIIKGLGAITSSLTHIGGTIGKSFEEGFTIVENRTSDIIQETRKHIRKKPVNILVQNQETNHSSTLQEPQMRTQKSPKQADQELQLKASRDVRWQLCITFLCDLKEFNFPMAVFVNEASWRLETESKLHGLLNFVRLQLETLLAEKARLAHENSVYARENRFLREVVEYHQLTMQDVVYLDESNEEVSEVNPLNLPQVPIKSLDSITPSATSLSLPSEAKLGMGSELTRSISCPVSGKNVKDSTSSEVTNISSIA